MRRIHVVSLIVLALAGCTTERPQRNPDFARRGGAWHGRLSGRPGGDTVSRPRHTFISPMGEPFRAQGPNAQAPDLSWFEQVDANHDGRITLAEFREEAASFFATLDVNKDGEIDPQELDRYETEIAPEVRMSMGMGGAAGEMAGRPGGGGRNRGGGRGGGRMGGGGHGGGFGEEGSGGDHRDRPAGMEGVRRGAGRFGYFDLPEPVIAADTNLNRGVSAKEFDDAAIERFGLLDTAHQGYLTRDTLPKLERESGRRRDGARQRGSDQPAED